MKKAPYYFNSIAGIIRIYSNKHFYIGHIINLNPKTDIVELNGTSNKILYVYFM